MSTEEQAFTAARQVAALDPTPRATENLLREVEHAKELFGEKIESMQEAVQLLQANADKSPVVAVVYAELIALKELTKHQFSTVQIQFEDRDKALTAALDAQQKSVSDKNVSNSLAIDKSEAGFIKQNDRLVDLITQLVKGTDEKMGVNKNSTDEKIEQTRKENEDKIGQLRSQIADLNNRSQNTAGVSKGMDASWGYLIGAIATVALVGQFWLKMSDAQKQVFVPVQQPTPQAIQEVNPRP